MNERLDQCCNHLKQEIETAEAALANVGHHISSATETGIDTLEHRLTEAKSQHEQKSEHASQAGQRFKDWLAETKKDALTKVEDWRTDREIGKLETDADEKEDRAADAILLAAFAILEAEVAIVEALKARKIAIDVAG